MHNLLPWRNIFLLFAILILLVGLLLAGFFLLARHYLRLTNPSRRRALLDDLAKSVGGGSAERLSLERKKLVGFFHPYCNAGGGGERVLWCAVSYMQENESDVISVVYTGDVDATKEEIITKVQERFGIPLDPASLAFVYLPSRHLVDGISWKRFTLLGQSLGSMWLAWEALDRIVPDAFIDTMGYAFTYPLIRALRLTPPHLSRPSSPRSSSTNVRALASEPSVHRIPIAAYVHYPTISTNMLRRVQNQETGVTNDASVSGSLWKTTVKIWYYRLFAMAYSHSLSQADRIVANGTWTKNHIDSLLARPAKKLETKQGSDDGVKIIFPPCDTEALQSLDVSEYRERVILSVAQFRPEKNQSAQLHALRDLLEQYPEYRTGSVTSHTSHKRLSTSSSGGSSPLLKHRQLSFPRRSRDTGPLRLVLLGSVRNPEDEGRVDALKELAKALGVEDHVEFVLNASYDELLSWLGRASVGVSSMIDEHFGINVVEFMAAGLIPVSHASGGPLLDIIKPPSHASDSRTGFLYTSSTSSGTEAEGTLSFPEALHAALSLSPEEEYSMRLQARERSRMFGVREFEQRWADELWNGLLSG
ncbi:uncharacterized protein EI90DRAFT_3052511 [Cantharellus anzutake]|uniref:uncharacterized protein n=1 Tax=Cantharellus anzutake TaxID=1750568 RepID=UPI001903BD0C|nr:uncharacterized protein EI90DRAFT_3052511 [Cantharellus anzutake]KAF8333595.1 hypothetical protein EI90DRAFT_3052511 [Cantharellus anzutake]